MIVRLADLLAAVLLGGALLVVAAVLAVAFATRRLTRWAEAQLGDDSRRGPVELAYALAAFPPRDVLLTAQRAAHGVPAAVAMESPLARAWLDQVRFDPATLSPPARPPRPPARLAVELGPRARRPLGLAFPVLFTAMGWGVGVSDDVRQVLAEAAALTGVAVNAGEGPVLPLELDTDVRWVWQWGRSSWQTTPSALPAAMIELQVGQASEGGTAVRKRRRYLPRVMRVVPGLRGPLRIGAGLARPLAAWVRAARTAGQGCPVAVKLPASQHVERDLARAVLAGADVIVLDGAGAGTAGSPAVLSDNLGIPAPVAVARARRWLDRDPRGAGVSLVASGHAHGAADIAKLLALGADAVAVGTAALVAMSHGQASAPLPAHGPTDLVLSLGGRNGQTFDRDLAAERLADWLVATREELALLCQALGLTDVCDLGRAHLVADTPVTARALGIAWYGEAVTLSAIGSLATQVRDAAARAAGAWDTILAARGRPPRRAAPGRRRQAGRLVAHGASGRG